MNQRIQPLKHLIFVALEPPQVYEDSHQTFLYATSRIPLDQVLITAPNVYQRLLDVEKRWANVLCIHADSNGNIRSKGLEIIGQYKPDMIFCCFPDEVRRLHPEFPLAAWHSGEILFDCNTDSTVIQIQGV